MTSQVAAAPRVRFPASGPFRADLEQRVDAWFVKTGRSPRASPGMRIKTGLLLTWLCGGWALLMFAPVPWFVVPLLAASMGLAMAGVGFSVMHDANHDSYAAGRRMNRTIGLSLDLLGASSLIWRQKHNVLHHTYTNVQGMDADLDAGPLLRFAPWQPRRPWHRFQHLYAPVLFALFPIRWFFWDDFRDLATGTVGDQPLPKLNTRDVLGVLAGKVVFFTWAFVLPLVLHPTWWLLPIYAIAFLVLGNALAWVFQLAHCLEDAEFQKVNPGEVMPASWAEHQVATTVDFAPQSRLLSWYLGGLNFQVEHHLFPRICHVHYPALSAIVAQTCRDHGLRYRCQPTVGSALCANLRWMRKLGAPQPV
jgi:linoleoyl-CoA desaturase